MRSTLDSLSGRKVLLVASTGGHLYQLCRLAPRLGFSPDSEWVTFDTPQSRSLLAGQTVHYVPYVAPRDWKGILRAWWHTKRLYRQFDGAVSTGAGLALGVLPNMAAHGKPAVFIESISRVKGPSVSGSILARMPKVGLYAQHGWARSPWKQGPSVLSTYQAHQAEPGAECSGPLKIFVTLGTIKPYRFDRLVDLVKDYVERYPDAQVRWQLGVTTRDDLPGEVQAEMSNDGFTEAIDWADVVVAHSGVGVCMSILDAGKTPVLLARQVEHGEHVDGHQHQIFDYLVKRGLAADAHTALASSEELARVAATTVSTDAAPLDAPGAQPDGLAAPVVTQEQHPGQKGVEVLTKLTDPIRDSLRPLHRRIAASLPIHARRQYLYFAAMLHFGNFTHPKTYTEKINWRIINDRRPGLIGTCDKLDSKKLARELVPDTSRLRIPETYWVGTSAADIPDELLGREGVLKPADGCGDVIFLPASREHLLEQTADWLTGEQSEVLGEWAYAQASKVMFIEEKVPFDVSLYDYKFKVFDGEALEVEVHTDRFTDHRCSHYDRDWR